MKQSPYRIFLLLAVLAGAFFFSFAIQAEPEGAEHLGWMTDFEAAKAKAAAENKPMLVDFTGSDWCIWCVKLDDEVFSKPGFQDYAKANLILVEIDFPRKKEQSAELKQQNNALAQKYAVRGYPTILLLDAKGEVLAKTGYRKGGPDQYVEHLRGLLADAKPAGI